MQTDTYNSPFNARYASKEMQYIYSPDFKFKTWRKLWIALAEAEHEGINYDVAREREKLVRHDVMSHVYAYGVQCPTAKPIIHLGATSCYVGDNTDVITMREALLRGIDPQKALPKAARQTRRLQQQQSREQK